MSNTTSKSAHENHFSPRSQSAISNLLREVSSGEVITILSRGKPVATISPASIDRPQKNAARLRFLKRLDKQNVSGSRNWTRDELYMN